MRSLGREAVGVARLVQRPLGFHNNPRKLQATVNRGTVQSWLLWFVGCAKKALLESANIIGGLEDELRVVGRQLIVCVGICGNLFVCCLQWRSISAWVCSPKLLKRRILAAWSFAVS